MGHTKQKTVLECIEFIFEKSDKSSLKSEFFEEIHEELNHLALAWELTPKQAFFLALLFSLKFERATLQIDDIEKHVKSSFVSLLKYRQDFQVLFDRGFIVEMGMPPKMQFESYSDIKLNAKFVQALIYEDEIPQFSRQSEVDVHDVLEKIYDLAYKKLIESFETWRIYTYVDDYLRHYSNFPFLKHIKELKMVTKHKYMLLYVIYDYIQGDEETDLSRYTERVIDSVGERINCIQSILDGSHELIKNKYLNIVEATFAEDTNVTLSDDTKKLLEEHNIRLMPRKKKQGNGVIEALSIMPNELLFEDLERQQISMIDKVLKEDHFIAMQKNLSVKGLPTGITAMFYGAPGTGKTELVKQLARQHNRDIMKVEISQAKSMWFGESEKVIKRIFTDYKALCKTSERTPILFFNEADAIFGKRKEVSASNVAQTENAMQNILLEELENFEGILMATTNLASNLDKAFERRFLFKIKFKQPSNFIRAGIWKQKMQQLKHSDCETLAQNFEFSGGQIDNVCRKVMIHEVVHGKEAHFSEILKFCSDEQLIESQNKIGF
jgi:hypothetical protein